MRLALVAAVLTALAAPAWGGDDLATDSQRLGYSIGYQVAGDLRRDGLTPDVALLVAGVRDALAGAEPRLSPEQMRDALAWLKRASEDAQRPAEDGASDP